MAPDERHELVQLPLRDAYELARGRMACLGVSPKLDGIALTQACCDATELLLGGTQLPHRDRQQRVGAGGDALLQPQPLLQELAPDPERRSALWRHVLLEMLDVSAQSIARQRRGIGEVTQQVKVIDVCEGPR